MEGPEGIQTVCSKARVAYERPCISHCVYDKGSFEVGKDRRDKEIVSICEKTLLDPFTEGGYGTPPTPDPGRPCRKNPLDPVILCISLYFSAIFEIASHLPVF